jgi:hypothetical protein
MTARVGGRWTRFREHLAAKIDPKPAMGEAWCVDCLFNEGRTRVISVDGVDLHLRAHYANYPDKWVSLKISKATT